MIHCNLLTNVNNDSSSNISKISKGKLCFSSDVSTYYITNASSGLNAVISRLKSKMTVTLHQASYCAPLRTCSLTQVFHSSHYSQNCSKAISNWPCPCVKTFKLQHCPPRLLAISPNTSRTLKSAFRRASSCFPLYVVYPSGISKHPSIIILKKMHLSHHVQPVQLLHFHSHPVESKRQ